MEIIDTECINDWKNCRMSFKLLVHFKTEKGLKNVQQLYFGCGLEKKNQLTFTIIDVVQENYFEVMNFKCKHFVKSCVCFQGRSRFQCYYIHHMTK